MKIKWIFGIAISGIVFVAMVFGSLFYFNQEDTSLVDTVESISPVGVQNNSNFNTQMDASILSFDLGEMTLKDESNLIQIPLKGSLVVPEVEGEYPIVFIFSDLNANEGVSRAYDEILAAIGSTNCLAIHLDLSELSSIEGYDEEMLKSVFDEYRQRLSQSLLGENDEFGVELTNKGSLAKVVMIGHGKSTTNVYKIALDQEYKQQLSLAGLLLIDPVDTNYKELSYPDVPTAIMLSEYNEDEHLVGKALYEDYRQEKARKSMTSLVYVKAGKFDDFNVADSELESVLNFEHNVEFVSQYIVDFLQSVFDSSPIGSGFTVLEMMPKTLYGAEVRTSLTVPNTMMLINAQIESNPTVNTLGGKIIANDINIERTTDGTTSFLMKWDDTNASLSIEIPKGSRDLSHYDAIYLYLSNQLSNEVMSGEVIQNQLATQSFEIELIDEQNQTSNASINSIEELVLMGTNEQVLYNERLVLNQFKEVDLTKIKQINLLFNQSSQGCIRLADLSFVKEPQ